MRREFFERGTVKQETYMLQTRPAHAKCPMCEAFLSEQLRYSNISWAILIWLLWVFQISRLAFRRAVAWKLMTLFGMKIDKHLNFT